MYATALKTLKDLFGAPSIIARSYINKVLSGNKIVINDRQTLKQFSLDITNALASLEKINYFADINTVETLRQIIRKLPDPLINRWKNVATDIRDSGGTPSIHDILKFIRKHVRSLFDPDFGDINRNDGNDGKIVGVDRRKAVHATSKQNPGPQRHFDRQKLACYVCSEQHRISDCPTFRDSNVAERIQLVKDNRLCFCCLNKSHMSKDCRRKQTCKTEGCTRTHHPLLHGNLATASSVLSPLDSPSIMPVVRVNFRSTNGIVRQGNCLIDSGAGTTIIRRDFAKALGLQGRREGLDLSVVGGELIKEPSSRRVKFWISSLDGGDEFEIDAHEINKTIISVPALDRQWLISLPHLRGINFPHKAGAIDLILGVQYSHLHVDNETRQGLLFEPVAKHTQLGWYVIGSDNIKMTSSIKSVNLVQRICFDKFYEFETLGVQAPDCTCPKNIMSAEDRRALDLIVSSCKHIDGRYEVGLPWKRDPLLLPNNYALAKKRLVSLESSLERNPAKASLYRNCMKEYGENGWACRLTDDELAADIKPVFYLPHHAISRPDKPSTPLRIVFDPACKYEGVSLNSFLHKGPCLIGNLLGILLRFREDRVAFVGDVSKMFLQVSLPEVDTHVHCFLWRDMDTSKNPDIYRLLRVTFGDKSSPDMASYAMLRIAEEHESNFPDEAEILRRDRYMDDLIYSCSTAEAAYQQIQGLDRILATGSFRIKEWFCSSENVREKLESGTRPTEDSKVSVSNMNEPPAQDSESSTSSDIHLGTDELKTLGIGWNPVSDVMRFSVKELSVKKFTKRNILSKMSTLYDPIGLASAVTIRSRMAMQDIWIYKQFDWDDVLPQELCDIWSKLFQELEKLGTVQFPRSLKPDGASGYSELHVFADASTQAYGAVAYLVWHTDSGPVVRLVSAKARVAPLKQSTVPRLELMAALIASRLAKTIVEEFKEKPGRVVLWTDSQIVLHWIHSDSISMMAFVGVRVSEIQSLWDSSHWRFVPTNLNPADDLSRGVSVEQMKGRWMNGPEFLQKPEDEWPVEFCRDLSEFDMELKKSKAMCVVTDVTPVIDPQRFSRWQQLVRVTAYCLRFIHNMKHRVQLNRGQSGGEYLKGSLLPSEIEKSEHYWMMYAQRELPDWETRFRDFVPFIKDGLVRVGGRLKHSGLMYDQIHPVLLPSSNPVSRLIMTDVHQRMGHSGAERTLSYSRRFVWIVRGRNLAKKVVKECTICRKLRQPPHTTLMADLPADRLKTFSPVYSVTGVDLFSPFMLKYGRNKSIKAWGALFTCATVRAVHLEIVADLSTQAFLLALRRFVARYGWPHTIISDNGSSYVGAQKELKKLLHEGKKQIDDCASVLEAIC